MYRNIANPFSKEIYVHGASTDLNEKIMLPNLIDLFIYAGLDHSEGTPISIKNLQAHNMSWVQLQAQYKINRMPELNENIKVASQLVNIESLYCNRDFSITNESGEILATAKAKWFLINLTKRRPIKPISAVYEIYDAIKRDSRLYDGEFTTLREADKYEESREFDTYYSDIDFNKHITSSCYFRWIVNSMPLEFMKNHTPKFIEAKFMAEVIPGDNITAEYKFDTNLRTSHRITTSNKSNFIAEIEWVKQ